MFTTFSERLIRKLKPRLRPMVVSHDSEANENHTDTEAQDAGKEGEKHPKKLKQLMHGNKWLNKLNTINTWTQKLLSGKKEHEISSTAILARPTMLADTWQNGAGCRDQKDDEEDGDNIGAFRFLDLPQEMRDEVYRLALTSTTPLSRYDHPLHCCNPRCGTHMLMVQSKLPVQLLRTCKQIYKEASFVMYGTSTFALHGVYKPKRSIGFELDIGLFKQPTNPYMMIKRFSLDLHLAPLLITHKGLPGDHSIRALVDHLHSIAGLTMSQIWALFQDEDDQCKRHRLSLQQLCTHQPVYFPNLQKFLLNIQLHPRREILEKSCGESFKVTVKLSKKVRSPEPFLPTGSGRWEPRRNMLSPLAELQNVESVDVEREWKLRYKESNDDDAPIVRLPSSQLWVYRDVDSFLVGAGYDLRTFHKDYLPVA